jgi:antitoxin component of MazEF toxin-antitoxin module
MIKTITKIGNSQGIIFDATLMDLANLKVGDQVNVTVHEGGAIQIMPTRAVINVETAQSTARRLIGKNAELFQRLS